MTQSLRRPNGRWVIYGAIGGFVGGVVMYAIMSGMVLAMGTRVNCFGYYCTSLGVAAHLITSTVIGAIFGVVISAVNKLRIAGFGRGIGPCHYRFDSICRTLLANSNNRYSFKDSIIFEDDEFADDAGRV